MNAEAKDEISAKYFANLCHARVKDDKDLLVCVDGPKGEGKSTFAGQQSMFMDPEFTFKRNYIFTPNFPDIKARMYGLPKYTPLTVDEAVKAMYKLDWTSTVQNNLIKLYTESRKKNKVTFFCIPFFSELRTSFRQNLVDIWVHILDRGRAIVFLPDPTPIIEDKWRFKDCQKLWKAKTTYTKTYELTADKRLELMRELPIYAGEMRFDDFSAEDKTEYLRCVTETEELEESSENALEDSLSKRYRASLLSVIQYLYEEHSLTQTQIAELVKMSLPTVNKMMRQLGIRPRVKQADAAMRAVLEKRQLPVPEVG